MQPAVSRLLTLEQSMGETKCVLTHKVTAHTNLAGRFSIFPSSSEQAVAFHEVPVLLLYFMTFISFIQRFQNTTSASLVDREQYESVSTLSRAPFL
jgi:hypothetical protein